MTAISSAGIAASWAATRADSQQQTMAIAALKQQAQADQSLVAMLEQSAQETKAAAPPGQGQIVDVRV